MNRILPLSPSGETILLNLQKSRIVIKYFTTEGAGTVYTVVPAGVKIIGSFCQIIGSFCQIIGSFGQIIGSSSK
jgi:hypothetical protein